MLILTGDFNINMLDVCHPLTKQFNELLYMFDLKQHVDKPTRIAQRSSSCLDLTISNFPKCVTYTNVLPCPSISDHDDSYACLNIRTTRFVPRYKYIRIEKNY